MVHLKNYMEEIVEIYIDNTIKKMKICNCEICRMDIIARTLNTLPPKYVVTTKGESYTKLNLLVQQFEVDIIAEITKAAQIVNKNPRHK